METSLDRCDCHTIHSSTLHWRYRIIHYHNLQQLDQTNSVNILHYQQTVLALRVHSYHHLLARAEPLHHAIIHLTHGRVGGASEMVRGGLLLKNALKRVLGTLPVLLRPQHVALVGADGGAHAGAVLAVDRVHGGLKHVRQDLQNHAVGGTATRGHDAAVRGAGDATRQTGSLRLLAEVKPHGQELRFDHPATLLCWRERRHGLPVAAEAEYARDGGVGHDLRLVVIEHDVPVVPRGNGLHQLVEARPVASRVLLAHLRVMLSTRRHLSTRNVSVHEAQHGHEHAYASAANRAPTLVQRTDEHVARRRRFEGVREGEDLGGMARACTHGVAGAHADRNVALAAQAQTHQRARVVARATHHLAGG